MTITHDQEDKQKSISWLQKYLDNLIKDRDAINKQILKIEEEIRVKSKNDK
jgi:hypothetical protein